LVLGEGARREERERKRENEKPFFASVRKKKRRFQSLIFPSLFELALPLLPPLLSFSPSLPLAHENRPSPRIRPETATSTSTARPSTTCVLLFFDFYHFSDRRTSTFSLSYLSLTLDLLPLSKLDPPPPQLTLVGKILDASEHASSTVLRVDDGTGIVSIKYWGDNDDEGGAAGDDGAAARRAAWQPGAYIRVHGNLRAFDGARSLVAFNVRPVADHNEITYHLAQCMLQHAHLSRASSGGATAIAANAAGGAAAAPAAAAKAENAAGGDPNAVGADGLTGAQREAKAQVAALGGGPQGAAVDDIVAALSGRVSEALVRDAVGFLLEEGHLYSTVDENHVKVA